MMFFVVLLQSDFEYRMNLVQKKKEKGQKHGQKGLFVTETTLSQVANLASIVFNLRTRVGELEDAVMEEADAKGDAVVSTSSSEFDPVENMVAIPIPPPTIHTLIPVEVPEALVTLSLQMTPSPPYIVDRVEDPVHDGVPEYWVDPVAGLS
jgi:hypothetical protein